MLCGSAALAAFRDEMAAKADVFGNRHDSGHVGCGRSPLSGCQPGRVASRPDAFGFSGRLRRHPRISRAKIIFVTVEVVLLWQNVKTSFATLQAATRFKTGIRPLNAAIESRFFAGRGHVGRMRSLSVK